MLVLLTTKTSLFEWLEHTPFCPFKLFNSILHVNFHYGDLPAMLNRVLSSLLACCLLIACGGDINDKADVPRNRSLIMNCTPPNTCAGQIQDYDSFNPFLPGSISSTGHNFLYEPLYFYNPYGKEQNLIPWIATGHEYNDDFTEVTIHLREGVKWSDGTPWTAADLVFTIDMLKKNAPVLNASVDMELWVAEASVVDDLQAKIALKSPNPRFVFEYLTNNFGNGIPIVPKHIWEGKDAKTFANLDLQRGWPVVSGPYRLVRSEPQQRIWDLRRDWWAAETDFRRLPRVERLIYLPYMDEDKRVQLLISNQMDTCLDLRPSNIKTILDQNPDVSTWTGREPPYGYLDWWPIALGFNNLEAPFADAEIRWAINHAIDRQQLVEVGWQGAGTYSLLPFPDFPSLRRFMDQIGDLLSRYPVGTHDPAKTAEIMQRQGWSLEKGIWTKEGAPFKITIDLHPNLHDIVPVLVEQLRRAGFDAGFRMTSDYYTRMTVGDARAFLIGNAGSVRDPYFTLRLYHSRYVQPTGTAAIYFWRWQNAHFDQIIDRMAGTAPTIHNCSNTFAKPWKSGCANCPPSRYSSGTTEYPTTKPTGRTGPPRRRPISTAPTGRARGCWFSSNSNLCNKLQTSPFTKNFYLILTLPAQS